MFDRRSISIVVVVAATTGIVIARVAGAGGPGAAAGRDDGDPDEVHSPGGNDNPYDDTTSPSHGNAPPVTTVPVAPPPSRQPVPLQNGMLKLPSGRFTMGSLNPHAPANERPPRTVNLDSFWIDRTEVTVGAYKACVDSGECARPARTSSACTFDQGDPELPVSCVHWRDADAYCRFAGKRLPSEREWEYAARGPFPTPFPWGLLASCVNGATLLNDQTAHSCVSRPWRVGTHPGGASTYGVQDMSGNVEEWTVDWYVESLGPGPAPRSGAAHVLRGGGWLSPPSMSRTTSRDWGSALEAGPNVGFRCARDE
ncbi:MAG TPA: formylglycine-generating enzyme family protein [Polyangiaceae bacterium]|jgi:formylglycine-generating enzyme required for sulfatase activity